MILRTTVLGRALLARHPDRNLDIEVKCGLLDMHSSVFDGYLPKVTVFRHQILGGAGHIVQGRTVWRHGITAVRARRRRNARCGLCQLETFSEGHFQWPLLWAHCTLKM